MKKQFLLLMTVIVLCSSAAIGAWYDNPSTYNSYDEFDDNAINTSHWALYCESGCGSKFTEAGTLLSANIGTSGAASMATSTNDAGFGTDGDAHGVNFTVGIPTVTQDGDGNNIQFCLTTASDFCWSPTSYYIYRLVEDTKPANVSVYWNASNAFYVEINGVWTYSYTGVSASPLKLHFDHQPGGGSPTSYTVDFVRVQKDALVNLAPSIDQVVDFSLDWGWVDYNITLNATDPETASNLLTYEWTNNDTSIVSAVVWDNATGILTLKPAGGRGSASINVTVWDGGTPINEQNSTTFNFYVTPPKIVFNRQDPIDIDSNNVLNQPANMSFNVSGIESITNTTFYFLLNGTRADDGLIWINGTRAIGWQTINNVDHASNDSDGTYYYGIDEAEIYPATYNIYQEYLEESLDLGFTLNSGNVYAKTELLNVSNVTQYNFFEFNASRNAGTTPLRVYMCNSSYTTGAPVTSVNCNQIGSIASTDVVNHTHSIYSSHFVVPLAINTTVGTIGTVVVTDAMQFLLRGDASGFNWDVSYMNNDSRAGAAQTTNTAGASWTTQAYTWDSHLHQFANDTWIQYYLEANNSLGTSTGGYRADLIEQGGLPPSVTISIPLNESYTGNISITWLAESPNQYDIIDTNISLLNGDNSLNQTIAFNVTSPYEWDSFNVGKIRYSSFRVQVDVADNMTQVGSRESALFTVDNRESPSIYVTDTTANEDFGTYDLTINATDPETPTNELTYSWTNNNTALTTLTINNATGIATFTSIPNVAGSASINISVTNNYGLQNSTTFNFIVNQVNDNPQFDPISSFSLNEDFGEYKINLNTNITDVEPHGSFWLTDSNTNKIYNYEKLTGIALGNIDLAPVGITGVRDLAIDFKDQTLWVIDQGSGFVYHIGRDGTNLTGGFDIKTAGASNASGICYDVSDDSLWITDFLTNNFVYHFDKNGNNLTGFAASTGGVENAYGITFDSTDYSLWIGDPIGNFVYHFDRSGNNLTGGFAMNHPDGFGIEFDTTDNSFWVVDLNDKFIYHHNAVGDNTTGGIAITQTGIRGVALDATGLTFNWTVSNTTVLNLNIFNVTGIAHFTSVANQSGTADVSISVVDAGGLSNSTSFTITVNAINDAPWWSDVNNASASISENSQNNNVSLNVSWQDYWNDVEGSPPTNPSVTTNDTSITTCSFNSGDLICNALLNATGSIAVKITAEDDIAQTAILNFELGINFMNQQPWVDGTLPSVDIQENTGGFFAWLWDIIRNIFRDVDQDQEPTSVEIISQSNSSVADCITIGVYYDNFDGENDTGAVLNPTLWNISENPSTSFLGNGQLHIDGQLNVLLTSIASKTSFKNVNFTIGNVEISAQGTGNNVGIYLSTTEGYQALIDGSNYPLPDVIPLMYLTGNESIPTNISVYWTSGTGLEVYLNDTLVSTYSDLTNTSYYIKFDSSAGGNPSNYSIDYVSGSGGNVTISCTTQPNATGINIVTVNYTNAGGLSVTTTGEVNVTGVNDAPWFDPIANTSVIQENQLSLNVSLQVPWQDSWHDVEDAYPSSSYLKTNNTDLSCALTSGDIVCSALNNASGAATISIEANDSEGGSAWVSFDLLMNHTNQQPWIDQIANVSVDEDVGLTVITTGVLLNWSFRDVEDDQNPANTTVFAQSNETVAVCFIDAITGGLSCNTGANQSGETTITLQFDDSEGLSVSEGITVFVTPINDAPNVDWTGLTPDGGNYSTGQPFYFNVTDVEDEVVNNCTIYRGGLYSNSTTTTVLGVSTNFIQYAMNASEAGIYSFTMECVDSVGSISNPTTAKVVAFDNILPSTAFTSPASDNSTTLFFTTPAGSVTLTLNISIYDIILNSTNITIWKADGTQVYNNYTSEWQSALFENKDDVTITQGNGTYYLEVKSLDYANNDPPELIQFDVLDGSDVQSLSTSIQTTQLPTKTYYYEANLTWNDNQYSDANIELNISNVTYTLTKSDDNTSYARFSSSIYTPLSREGETSPYSFNINLTATNGTILSNNTAATGSITNGNVQFDICNDTLVDPAYLEFNFLDESNTTIQLSAALADGTYIDYTLDPARQEYRRMYYNTVGVTSGNYTFCTNQNETYYITDFMLYYATGYSQRTHQQPHTLTESIHNETLYLVSNTVGSYITFNTYNPAGSPISNVAVVSERQISGVWTTVETKYTDAAGVVLFLVDVTSPYRFTFTKTGYEDLVYTPSIPIQTATAYTIILQTTTGTTIESYSTGVSYDIKPKNATLTYNTTYNFSIDLTSEYFTTIDEVGIWLTNGTDNITSLVTCSGDVACSTSLLGYTGMNPQIKMYYYWRVNGTVSSPQFFKSWWVSQAYTGNGSLQNLVDDINAMTYRWDSESRERFSFTTALLSFFLVMIATGTLSYVSGIYSPAALLVFATGCFWMLAVIGLLPAMGGHWWLIPAMITIVTASYYAFETIRI